MMADFGRYLLSAWTATSRNSFGSTGNQSGFQAAASWVAFVLFTPAPQQVFISTVQLLFLVTIGVLALLRLVTKRRKKVLLVNGISETSSRSLRISNLFIITLSLNVLVCLVFFLFAAWRVVVVLLHGWRAVPPQEFLFSISQALTWAVYTVIIGHEKKFRSVNHAPALRIWWIVNFFLSLLLFCTSVVRLAGVERSRSQVWLDCMFGVAPFPVVVYLLIIALLGDTGITLREPNDDLNKPLLQKLSDRERIPSSDLVTSFHSASLFSKATFLWLNPLLKLGMQKPLDTRDVPQLSPDDKADRLYAKLIVNYESLPQPRSLRRALLMTFWPQLAFTGFLALSRSCVLYVGPMLITRFVDFASGEEKNLLGGLGLVALLLLAKCVEVLSAHNFNFLSNKLGMMLRSALITTIYRKGLVLSSLGRQSHGTGQIVNYMSVDVQQISDSMLQIHNIWSVPLQVAIALGVLLSVVGISCFAGIAAMLVILAISFTLARIQRNCQGQIMSFKDKRMAVTTEVLNSMKVIKLQAWEDTFRARVEEVRNSERHWLSKFMYCLAFNVFFLWLGPVCVSTITFAVCILLGRRLTTGRVFTTVSTFRVMQEPLRLFPQALMAISQSLNSIERIQRFLWSEELDPTAVERLPFGSKYAVQVEGGSFSWNEEGETPTVRGVQVQVTQGSLVCIVGQVGSGKSTLLEAILGEVPKVAGMVRVSGSMAYVSQSAWIQNATIEQNIRFGKPMDTNRYQRTLQVCSLSQDLAQMMFGDKTEIGERGINLSGGQKQRIQLARAVYQDADIYLLDDVFSAVDAHTGSALFKDCVKGALSNKTILLVTHQVDFLHAADQIWVLRDGEVVQSGKYDELLDAGLDFGALVAAHNEAMDLSEWNEGTMGEDEAVLFEVQELSSSPLILSGSRSLERQLTPVRKMEKSGSERSSREQDGGVIRRLSREHSIVENVKKPTSRLIEEEEREQGQVSWRVYWLYMTKVLYGFHVLGILFVQTCWQGLQLSSDYYLSYATSKGDDKFDARQFLLVYAALAIGSAMFVFMRSLLVAFAGLRTAQSFFLTFLHAIIDAPMSFFDTTPTGRILSRFATDQWNVDIFIPLFLGVVLAIIFQCVGVLVVVIQVTWYMIFVVVPLGVVFFRYQRYYMASSRELTRIDNITKAPVIHHFSETIAGFTTIRAFKEQDRFKSESLDRVNSNLRMDFHNNASNEWLGFRLEMMGTSVLCTSALFMVTIGGQLIPSNLVALSLSYGLALNSILYALVFLACQLENKMVSVERIDQYCRIPREAAAVIENRRPSQDWPQKGNIQLQKLQLRYRPDMPLVLKGISLSIKGGETVGVVGRTGSGKSTLILALFRLVEPAGGHVLIDGLDISTIGLKDLRSRLGIIPQEPVLFEGTIRSNIDPVGLYNDAEIWRALEKCQLADIVREKERKLDSLVLNNGENWSMGQRQLFCLGRVLLKKSTILMLDEATASVDAQTDAIMQKTIRAEFNSSTVISIAHRIATVMDSDKVVVLDSGHVVETGSPSSLLDDPSSLFAALVREYTTRSII